MDIKRQFSLVSLLSVAVSLRFFTEDRFYQYLQDATLFGLLSDKSTVYFNSENLIGIGFSILATFHLGQHGMQMNSMLSCINNEVIACQPEFQFF